MKDKHGVLPTFLYNFPCVHTFMMILIINMRSTLKAYLDFNEFLYCLFSTPTNFKAYFQAVNWIKVVTKCI